jgi:hypothetical protein
MLISFRTKRFDVETPIPEGACYGEDLAKWLQGCLSGWKAMVYVEDWGGWAVLANKDTLRYLFVVYDHDIDDVTELGPKWVIRLFNEKDWKNWFRSLFLFKYIPPVAHDQVTAEIVHLLSGTEGIAEVTVEPLTI